MNPFKLEWQAPEFEYRRKDISWYWISIIFTVILLGIAVWQKNFLFGVFIIVAEILVLVWGNKEPAVVHFILTEKGLDIDGRKFYPLSDIVAFSLDEHSSSKLAGVTFRFKRRLRPVLKINIPKEGLAEFQENMKNIVPKEDPSYSLIDTLEKFLGF